MGKLQKLDNRIRLILQNGVRDKHRTVFVMIGNKGQDQVPIMHQILNSLFNKGRLSLLWCYKKELSFSTHRKKNLKLLNKRRKAGLTSDTTIFEQFICTTDIRWCYYHESHKILGQTFDMCILQDFEALTPNTIARTVETVTGGGLIVFLLNSMDSLRQLFTMTMDVHSRYRTEVHKDVVCRFNERFLLSLANNYRCLVLDDRWHVLPLSRKVLNSTQPRNLSDHSSLTTEKDELSKLKVALTEGGSPFAPLVKLCITLDQARSLVQFCASIASTYRTPGPSNLPTLRNTPSIASFLGTLGAADAPGSSGRAVVIVTASRGRGKSAALGLGLSAAFEAGLPNMYVTAPSPENLGTLMYFTLRGLNALGYEEHHDYAVTRSSHPEHNRAVIRIDVRRQTHRQMLVYLPPWELAGHLSNGGQNADLVCIDEAAAIPITLVRRFLIDPRMVFMASTINGYEGTGRSLSLKLVKELRNECRVPEASLRVQPQLTSPIGVSNSTVTIQKNEGAHLGNGLLWEDTSRVLYEVTLTEAIRYANGDPVEAWLTELLCLDCGSSIVHDGGVISGAYYPPVDQCNLYYVNRDTLFAYHKSTEVFLHRLMALYVASHYRNSPNDLQLLSDAPAHHIFCLLAPYDPDSGKVPEILCVLQVCLEGRINKSRVLRGLSRGLRPSGDLIPWTISQHFCDSEFGELSGARIVRIATHPDYQNLGYGTRALDLLHDYYGGKVKSKSCEADGLSMECELAVVSSSRKTTPGGNGTVTMMDFDDEDEDITGGMDTIYKSPSYDRNDTRTDSLPSLLTEAIERRSPSSLPPLLSRLSERPPEELHYIGVSFGATPVLLRFWKRAGYIPVYLRQTLNELTCEFSCIMLSQLRQHPSATDKSVDWLLTYHLDFTQRFMRLLPGCFRHMDAAYALELLQHKMTRHISNRELTVSELRDLFTPIDLDRLHSYVRSMVDFQVVSDLLPRLASLYFDKRFPKMRMNKTQQTILLGLGLQHKTVERLASEFAAIMGSGSHNLLEKQRRLPGVSVSLLQTEKVRPASGGLDAFESCRKPNDSGVNGTTGWAKRVRGLLFVIVREMVQSLDAIFAAKPPCSVNAVTLPLNSTKSSMHGNAISSFERSDKSSDSEIDELVEAPSTIVEIPEPSIPEEPEIPELEIQRRTDIVRQLLTEEVSSGCGSLGTLNNYKVHGSESDWAKAIVGHGSALESLNILIPKSKKRNGKTKRHSSQGEGAPSKRKNALKLKKAKPTSC